MMLYTCSRCPGLIVVQLIAAAAAAAAAVSLVVKPTVKGRDIDAKHPALMDAARLKRWCKSHVAGDANHLTRKLYMNNDPISNINDFPSCSISGFSIKEQLDYIFISLLLTN